jgi:hypothetical protein
MSSRKIRIIAVAFTLAASSAFLAVGAGLARAYTLYACHDDTSIARAATHGSPLNGSFGRVGASFNHSNGYYYLNVKSTSDCPAGADGLYHYVLHITANGIGVAPGCVPQRAHWGPSCYDGSDGGPDQRMISGAALAAESPAWGLETKTGNRRVTLRCTGGNANGGYPALCPNSPPVTARPGNATIEWRYDGPQSSISQRIDDQYWDADGGTQPLWETATLDVVPCSSCEPGVSSGSPSMSPSGSPSMSLSGGPSCSPSASPSCSPSDSAPATDSASASSTGFPTPAPSVSTSPAPTPSAVPSNLPVTG